MADLCSERRFRDDDARTFNVIVNKMCTIMEVIESMRYVCRDLHSRNPGGKDGKTRTFRVPETSGKVGSSNVIVDEIHVVSRD